MIRKGTRMKPVLCAVIGLWLVLTVSIVFAGQKTLSKESDVEKLLGQAKTYLEKGDYKLAIGCYLEASALTQNRLNLSQAYFGLSLSYFNLRDTANAAKYIRKDIEVDPNKEISELFYPRGFVQLFGQIRKDIVDKKQMTTEQVTIQNPVPDKTEAAQKPVKDEKKTEEARKEAEAQNAEKPKEEEKKNPPPVKTAPPSDVPAPQLQGYEVPEEAKGGNWEISAHYSSWGINFIKTLFEDSLAQKAAEEVQGKIVEKCGTIQAGLQKLNFVQNLAFDSQGSNYGLEIRYFSAGRAGTFSLGLAFEKTDILLSLKGTARQDFTNGGSASTDVEAKIQAAPFTTHINFRWEVGSNARITPYFVAGFGFAPLSGTFSFTYSGTYQKGDLSQNISDSQEKTLTDFSNDIDFKIPTFIVILQLQFGIKAQLYKGLYLLGEAGFWDGLILRGGLAYRF
jgi:tetratricopeptide (TPR) repeat protein